MRGYRRRGASSYLLGVATSFLLVAQLGGSLLQLPDRPYWGLWIAGMDQTVRRVAPGSPADLAGIRENDEILSFGGADWARTWERQYADDQSVLAEVRSPDGSTRTVRLESGRVPRVDVVRQLVFGFIVLSFVLIGLVVFLSRSDHVATLFFLMCLLISRIMLPEPDVRGKGVFLLDRMVLDISYLFLPPVVLHFFLNFPQRARLVIRHPRAPWLLYIPSAVAAAILLKFDVDLVLGGRVPSQAPIVQTVTALISVAMIVTGVWLFLRGVRRVNSPVLRRSLRWVVPGTALGILPPLLLSVVLNVNPSLEIPGDRYAFLAFLLVPISFAHAIIRYGLMDLELVVKRSVVYTALTALLAAVYYLVAEVLGSWVMMRTGTGRTLLSFAVVFGAALAFMPLRDRVQGLVDRTLYRHRYNYRSTLRSFSSAFATFLERDQLVRLLTERLPELLGAQRAVLFIRSSPDESLHLADTRGLGPRELPYPLLSPSRGLLAWWKDYGGPIPFDPRRDPRPLLRLSREERTLLTAVEPDVIVLLPRERHIEGLLLLGPKASGERYRAEDLELLATLGDQAGTALSASRLHEEALERRRLEEELAVARRIQASLLPSQIPRAPGVEIGAMTRPCLEVGGDFYDLLDFGGGGLGLAVGDVSGKGVPAALLLSSLQATLRAEAGPEDAPDPVVRKINARLCTDMQPGSFASLLYGRLDPVARSFRYVNAGHPAGIVVARDGAIRRLDRGGLLLGVQARAEYECGVEVFSPGEMLVLYSDGVTDVLNGVEEEYGTARLEMLLPRLTHLPVAEVVDSIVTSVEAFVGGRLPDDVTLLVAKFLPEAPLALGSHG
ncbi:MAG: SpoIIE family protein phosphatase [Candidatus Eiseniibacteriota bacterium]